MGPGSQKFHQCEVSESLGNDQKRTKGPYHLIGDYLQAQQKPGCAEDRNRVYWRLLILGLMGVGTLVEMLMGTSPAWKNGNNSDRCIWCEELTPL